MLFYFITVSIGGDSPQSWVFVVWNILQTPEHICVAHRGCKETLCFSSRTWQKTETRWGGLRPILSCFEASIYPGVSTEMRESGVHSPCHGTTSSHNLGGIFLLIGPLSCSPYVFGHMRTAGRAWQPDCYHGSTWHVSNLSSGYPRVVISYISKKKR